MSYITDKTKLIKRIAGVLTRRMNWLFKRLEKSEYRERDYDRDEAEAIDILLDEVAKVHNPQLHKQAAFWKDFFQKLNPSLSQQDCFDLTSFMYESIANESWKRKVQTKNINDNDYYEFSESEKRAV